MRKHLLLGLTCAVFLFSALAAQENKPKKVLTNADIVMMTQNHFDDETLIKIIQVSETDFDISGDALIALKNQGVSSTVLRAMLQATQDKRRGATETSVAPKSDSALPVLPVRRVRLTQRRRPERLPIPPPQRKPRLRRTLPRAPITDSPGCRAGPEPWASARNRWRRCRRK